MHNDIIKLLNLEDEHLSVELSEVTKTTKVLTLSKPPSPHFCPVCDFRMHSKGIRIRTLNHPVLQDGFKIILKVHQRRYQCTNPFCKHTITEEYRFIDKHKRNTNITDILILEAFRDHNLTASQIARRFNVSVTYAIDVFDRYVNMKRLPLSNIISIDEVHLSNLHKEKYALVIHDFITSSPIDILKSRRNEITEPYFVSLNKAERLKVEYLVVDMYKPYLNYVNKYFPNAKIAVDSFHVISWIIRKIKVHLNSLVRYYIKRDIKILEEKQKNIHYKLRLKQSDEVYLLKKYSWLILKNNSDIDYGRPLHKDRHFHYLMNLYDYEHKLFKISPELETIRDLKEMYIKFNSTRYTSPNEAAAELSKLISYYNNCEVRMFKEFASLLNSYFDEIVNSFTCIKYVDENGEIHQRRLSNGPIESFNRIPKDIRRNTRGILRFEHMRNRILFSCRKDAPISGNPNR